MRQWNEAVATVKRVTGPILHRMTASGIYDPRGPPRSLSLHEQFLMSDAMQAVAAWNGHDSSILLAPGGEGVKQFSHKQLGFQKWLCGSEGSDAAMAPEALLQDFPPDPSGDGRPLAASALKSTKIQYIKDLCQRHRGEVREIKGEWTEVDSPFPRADLWRRTLLPRAVLHH